MIATLKRFLAPSPPPPPWAAFETELARLEPQVEQLREQLGEAHEEFMDAADAARIARDALEAADGSDRPAMERAYRAAVTARGRAERRYNDLRARWPKVSSRRRQLRERVRVLRLLES